MQLTIFLKAIRASMVLLYSTELITVSLLTYGLFDICLLSLSILLTFFLMQAIQLVCEAFDEMFGLKGFARRNSRYMLIMKLLMIITIMAFVCVYHYLHNGRLERLGAELWIIGVSEMVSLVLGLIKTHVQRQSKKSILL